PQDLDTLVLTQLKVNVPDVTTAAASICAGDSLFLAGAFRTASGTYSDTLTSALGCDSVHHFVTLTVLDTFLTEQQVSICAGDSFLAGGAYQQTAGTYFDHLHTQNGCDSLVATQLTVDDHVATDTAITIIDGDSIFLGGSFQTTTGTYLDTLMAANGCDSVVTTTLDVITSITFPGGNDGSFGLRIIPNPANDVVSIMFSQPQTGSVKFSLLALDGRLLEQWQHTAAGGNEQRISRSIGHLANGTYLLRLQDARGGTSVKRVVIHHP
ncbi:MAG: T9SS type A sorting domain-containing protein, partial [Bacteroidota bacterium]